MSNQTLLTTAQAAKLLGISKAYLERDRWKGASIPYLKVGRAVRYRQSDLETFLEKCTCPTLELSCSESRS